jgi:hypothetical protein
MLSASVLLTENLTGSETCSSEDESERRMGLIEEFPFMSGGELR